MRDSEQMAGRSPCFAGIVRKSIYHILSQVFFNNFNASPNCLTARHSIYQRWMSFLLVLEDGHSVP